VTDGKTEKRRHAKEATKWNLIQGEKMFVIRHGKRIAKHDQQAKA
jgi:hypothetical protein